MDFLTIMMTVSTLEYSTAVFCYQCDQASNHRVTARLYVFYLDSQGTSSALFQSIQLNATCKWHCPPYAAMLRLSKAKFISKNDTVLVMEKISPFISLRGGGRSPNQQFLLNNYLCNRKLKIAEFLILIVLVILNLVLPVLTTASKQRNQAVL